ncbi:hypothetical protein LTS09_011136 [Friedmanniomyces endolithicus]|nr:hypothetical protein LTS09_011136 [Friedmanniomyces endolithicus]
MRFPQEPITPHIDGRESFDTLVRKLSVYFVQQIQTPQTWEELRTVLYSKHLKPLVTYLVDETHHPAVVNALLALKWHFATVAADDDRGVGRARGLACELIAWRFVTHLTEPDAIDFLCYELPAVSKVGNTQTPNGLDGTEEALPVPETTPLLDGGRAEPDQSFADEDEETTSPDEATSFASFFAGLNALEIAAVADAKKFLCQKSIQRVVDGIWKGDITFWETFGQHSTKQAKVYSERRSDPFCRLRVPLYSKVFEVMFFAAFLTFYYIVLEQKSAHTVTGAEIMLYIWFASFAYNEAVEFWDAGIAFYAIDFWSLWDLGIIATGAAFLVVRIVGMAKNDHELSDIAFDILSVEALFLVPRICSLLSLVPYFGTLIPCLKEMTKDFIKFLSLVAILYVGFDTTFVFLARGTMSAGKINWILIQVFFGSSYLGFGIAEEISPLLGPPLMFVFVCLTNFLLLSTLISLLSNSLTKVIEHAREEYLSVYAIFVLEASTSNRLTYFIPPLNLLPVLLRPLRLVMSAEKLRTLRIVLLKATHWPFVGLILAWERARLYWNQGRKIRPSFGLSQRGPYATRKARRDLSGMSFQRPLLANAPLQPPLDEQAHADRSCSDIPTKQLTAAPETVEALETAVHELRAQVKALASILASEKSKTQTTHGQFNASPRQEYQASIHKSNVVEFQIPRMSSRLSAAATSDDKAAQAGRTQMMQVGYTLAIRPVPRCRYAKPGLTTGSPLKSGARRR